MSKTFKDMPYKVKVAKAYKQSRGNKHNVNNEVEVLHDHAGSDHFKVRTLSMKETLKVFGISYNELNKIVEKYVDETRKDYLKNRAQWIIGNAVPFGKKKTKPEQYTMNEYWGRLSDKKTVAVKMMVEFSDGTEEITEGRLNENDKYIPYLKGNTRKINDYYIHEMLVIKVRHGKESSEGSVNALVYNKQTEFDCDFDGKALYYSPQQRCGLVLRFSTCSCSMCVGARDTKRTKKQLLKRQILNNANHDGEIDFELVDYIVCSSDLLEK